MMTSGRNLFLFSIPAGTGMRKYDTIIVGSNEEYASKESEAESVNYN